jgi:8-oxo-dGTP pyrophosphatase MutT (NUDIX family)
VEDETLSSAETEKDNSTEEIIDTFLSNDTSFSTDSSKVAQMRESLEKSTTTTRSQLLNLNDFHMQQRAHRRGDLQKRKESLQGLHNFQSPPPQTTPTKESSKKLQQDSKAADRAAIASYMFLRQQTGNVKKKYSKTAGTVSAKCKHGEGPAAGIPHAAARKWCPSPEALRQIIVTDVDEFYMQQHAIHLEDARKKREVLHISDRSILSPDRKSTSPRSFKKPTIGFVASPSLFSSHSMDATMGRSFEEKVEEKCGSQDSLHTGTKLFLEAQFAGYQHAADEPAQFNVDSSINVQDTGDDEPTSSQTEDSLEKTDAALEKNAVAKELGSPSKLVDESGVNPGSADDVLVDPDILEDSDSPNLIQNVEKDGGELVPPPVEHNPDTSAQNDEPAEVLSELSTNDKITGIGDEPVEDVGETSFVVVQIETYRDVAIMENEPVVASSLTNEDETDFGDPIKGVSCEETEIKAASTTSSKDAAAAIEQSAVTVAVTYPLLTQLSHQSSEKIGLISRLLSDEPSANMAKSIPGDPVTNTLLSGELSEDRVNLRTSEWSTAEESRLVQTRESLESKNAADSVDTKPDVDLFVAGAVIAENNAVVEELEAPSKPADESPEKLGFAEADAVDPDIRKEPDNQNFNESIDQMGDKVTPPPPAEHDPGTSDMESSEVLSPLSELLSDESISNGSEEPVKDQEIGPPSKQADRSTEDLASDQDIVVDPDTSEDLDSHNIFESAKKGAGSLAPPPVEHKSCTMDRDEPPEVLPSLSLLQTIERTKDFLDEPIADKGEAWCTTDQFEADSGDAELKGDWQEDIDEHGGSEVVAENETEADELGQLSLREPPEKTAPAKDVAVDSDSREEADSQSLSESVELTRDVEHDGDEPTPVQHDPGMSAQNDESLEWLPSLPELLTDEIINIDDMVEESIEHDGEVPVSPEHLEAGDGDAGYKIDQREAYDETVASDVTADKKESHADYVNGDRTSSVAEEDACVNVGDCQDEDAEEQSDLSLTDDMAASDKHVHSCHRMPPTPESSRFHILRHSDENEGSATTNEEEVDTGDVNEVRVASEDKSTMLEAVEDPVGTVLEHDAIAATILSTSESNASDTADSENTAGESNADEIITEIATSSELNAVTDEAICEPVASILNDPAVNDQITLLAKKKDNKDHDSEHAAVSDEEVMVTENSVKSVNLFSVADNFSSPALKGSSRPADTYDSDATLIAELPADEPPLIILKESPKESPNLWTIELSNEEAISSDNHIENTSLDQAMEDTSKVVSDDMLLASAGKPAHDEFIEIVSSESQSHPSTDGDLDETNVTQPDSSNIHSPSMGSTDVATEPVVKVDYKSADYRGFVFVGTCPLPSQHLLQVFSHKIVHHFRKTSVHRTHGLVLLHCTRKKEKGPHFQLPGGHVDEQEFLAAGKLAELLRLLTKLPSHVVPCIHYCIFLAESSRDAQTQLLIAARAGAARELYEETGMDLRYQLDRLEPAALRSDVAFDKHGKPTLNCELKHRLYFFLPVSDEDFLSTVR